MRIAWFTPFTKNSAIGKYSRVVTDGLSKSCEVDIWLSESDNLLPTKLKKVSYQSSDDLSRRLSTYDFVIYNMGDYLNFHKDIYEVSKVNKGIIILHDFVMHHFFTGYYFQHKKDNNAYVRDMERFYGEAGARLALNSLSCKEVPIWDRDDLIKYPLFEGVIEGAKGIIVHSKYFAEKVKPKFFGVIQVIYFPFDSFDEISSRCKSDRSGLGLPKDKIIIVTIGHVNQNKRVDKVIEVLAEDKELAKKILYIVIGPYEENRGTCINEVGSLGGC